MLPSVKFKLIEGNLVIRMHLPPSLEVLLKVIISLISGWMALLYLMKKTYQNEYLAKSIHVLNTSNISPRANVCPVAKIVLKLFWQDTKSEI